MGASSGGSQTGSLSRAAAPEAEGASQTGAGRAARPLRLWPDVEKAPGDWRDRRKGALDLKCPHPGSGQIRPVAKPDTVLEPKLKFMFLNS